MYPCDIKYTVNERYSQFSYEQLEVAWKSSDRKVFDRREILLQWKKVIRKKMIFAGAFHDLKSFGITIFNNFYNIQSYYTR